MDLLITVIGNMVVNEDFRAELWPENGSAVDPLLVIEKWGFHLTKGEGEILVAIIRGAPAGALKSAFQTLWSQMYPSVDERIAAMRVGCGKPCIMSVGKLPSVQQAAAQSVTSKELQNVKHKKSA